MNMLAKDILRIAKELLVEVEIGFERVPEVENSIYGAVHTEMQRMADKIRQNEGVEVIVARRDTKDTMEIGLGISDHEAKKAILEEFGKLASKLARRNGIGSVSVNYL